MPGTRFAPSISMLVFSSTARSKQRVHANRDLLRLLAEADDDRLADRRRRARQRQVGVEGRAVDLGHQVGREHQTHDLADRVGADHARDLEPARDLDRDRRLARAGGAAEQHQARLAVVARGAPDPVAARRARRRACARASRPPGRAARCGRSRAGPGAAVAPRSRAPRRARRRARAPRPSATPPGCPSRTGCPSRSPRPRAAARCAVTRRTRVEVVAIVEQLVDEPRELADEHLPRGGDAVADRRRGLQRDIEGHAARDQRLHEDPAHEGPRPVRTDDDQSWLFHGRSRRYQMTI